MINHPFIRTINRTAFVVCTIPRPLKLSKTIIPKKANFVICTHSNDSLLYERVEFYRQFNSKNPLKINRNQNILTWNHASKVPARILKCVFGKKKVNTSVSFGKKAEIKPKVRAFKTENKTNELWSTPNRLLKSRKNDFFGPKNGQVTGTNSGKSGQHISDQQKYFCFDTKRKYGYFKSKKNHQTVFKLLPNTLEKTFQRKKTDFD